MKNTKSRLHGIRALFGAGCVLALSMLVAHVVRGADKPAAAAALSPEARALLGTWVHVGVPGKTEAAPEKGGFIKLRTERHWAAIAVNARSGLVTSTHGGTWSVKGNEYRETVEYGGDYQAQWIGKTYTWTLKIEGDTMTKQGTNNAWHEVWQRVK